MRFAADQVIQLHGDSGEGFWLIESGEVTLCRFGAEGEMTVYASLGPGELFGELAHFAGVPRQVDAVAGSAAVLVRIEADLVDHLLAQHPSFARWLLKSLANQLRVALDRIEGFSQMSAQQRIIQLLVEMAQRDGPRIVVTQQRLGELTGTSRITTGQVLRRLARLGHVSLEYRSITVHKPGAMTELHDA